MTNPRAPTALIADDEPRLAHALAAELRRLWPELEVIAIVANGEQALAIALQHHPDVVFLDIRMPAMDGLDAAGAILEDWPDDAGGLPLIVFVTAFDEFAVRAFDRAAVDYVLKPASAERLTRTVERLKARLIQAAPTPDFEPLAAQLRDVLSGMASRGLSSKSVAPEALSRIRAGVGDTVKMIALEDVVMFEATDKYVNVVTTGGEALIRESLRELMPRLDPRQFVQIHRGRIVNLDFVESAQRLENGKLQLQLRGRPERPTVSRLYQHLFRAM